MVFGGVSDDLWVVGAWLSCPLYLPGERLPFSPLSALTVDHSPLALAVFPSLPVALHRSAAASVIGGLQYLL